MTVETTTTIAQTPANGTTTVFNFDFTVLQASDLIVGTIDASGLYTQITSGYTVSDVGEENGFITFDTAPIAGLTVDIRATPQILQPASIGNSGKFLPETHEKAFDRITLAVQALERRAYRFNFKGPDNEVIEWPAFPGAAARANTFPTFDSSGLPVLSTDFPTGNITRALLAGFLFPPTVAEQNTAVPIADQGYIYGMILRYGIVPNDQTAAASNTTYFTQLTNPTLVGPTGEITFQNTTGADTYYFSGMVDVRPGLRLNLNGCTLVFSKASEAADNFRGFLNLLQGIVLENGKIVIDYPGTGGLNPGAAIRIGSRNGYAFGNYPNGVFDQDDGVQMGSITLRNLTITSNNPAAAMILGFGGAINVLFDNVDLDGQSAMAYGVYYEFGWSSKNGSGATAAWSSSHAKNWHFRNCRINNLNVASAGAGIAMVGAYSVLVENLWVQGAYIGYQARAGEALYYRPWPNVDDVGAKRCTTIRNFVGTNIANTGLALIGAEAATGYLSGSGLTPSQQTDLMSFSVDGFAIESAGAAISLSGPGTIANGHITGTNASGGILITDDCRQFDVNEVIIEGQTGDGIRANIAGIGVWATPLKKRGEIRNSIIKNGLASAIALNNTQAVTLINNQLGANATCDSSGDETTQSTGVNLGSAAFGVEARQQFITVASGFAYASAGTGDRGNDIVKPRGTTTSTPGAFLLDGIAQANSTAIGSAANIINSQSKYLGKKVWDSSNSRMLYAAGSLPTDKWYLVDGSTFVTPA